MYRVRLIERLVTRKRGLEKQLEAGDRRNEREYKLILKGIETLKRDFRAGDHISRKHKGFFYYRRKYGIESLWKLNVSKDGRLVYTIVSDGTEVISIILEIMDHKSYDKRFGYHTS